MGECASVLKGEKSIISHDNHIHELDHEGHKVLVDHESEVVSPKYVLRSQSGVCLIQKYT